MTSASQSPPDDKLLANFTIRNVLETLRELSPTDYVSLLRDAGLANLTTADLGDDAPRRVRGADIARLYGAVYKLTGETLTRVFLTNYGHKMAPMLLKHPTMVRLLAEQPSVPKAERVAWAMREIPSFLNEVWAAVGVREDDEAYYLEIAHCPICAEIHGTRGAICASSEFLYTALARALTGQRLSFLEWSCRAHGDPLCAYRLRK